VKIGYIKFFLLLGFGYSNLFGWKYDTTLMRIAVLSSISSAIFTTTQEENSADFMLHYNFNSPSISLYKGKESGEADRALKNIKISLSYDWNHTLYEDKNILLYGYTELYIDRFKSTLESSLHGSGYIVALVPMFKYEIKKLEFYNLIPYVDMGVGVALMDTTMVENREKSTHFQFSDNIGFGFSYKKTTFGYRFTHISNLGVKMPNPGLDFHQLHFRYMF